MRELPTNYPRNICAYCGATDGLTKDHIPPEQIFPSPRPSNLITVPTCGNCHSDTSKDDEYFRLKVCLREDAGNHPKARKNWDAIFRSLNRMEASGFQKSFFADMHNVQLSTPAGIFIGQQLGYDVNMIRIRRVVERITRGLYFAERGSFLGFHNEVRVHADEDLHQETKKVLDELSKNVLLPLAAQTPKIIGDNVFSYRFHITDENPAYSVWGFSFYGSVPFLCFTGPGSNSEVGLDRCQNGYFTDTE
ncbi:MAG: hypothetical protein ABII89_07680 [Candidatus Omnitrophota bacterium]